MNLKDKIALVAYKSKEEALKKSHSLTSNPSAVSFGDGVWLAKGKDGRDAKEIFFYGRHNRTFAWSAIRDYAVVPTKKGEVHAR